MQFNENDKMYISHPGSDGDRYSACAQYGDVPLQERNGNFYERAYNNNIQHINSTPHPRKKTFWNKIDQDLLDNMNNNKFSKQPNFRKQLFNQPSQQGIPKQSPNVNIQSKTPGGKHVENLALVKINDAIPVAFRHIFEKYTYFNLLQSKMVNDILLGDKHIVVSAPTGSGKTHLFDFAIIRLLHNICNGSSDFKIVYIAPVKALCTERFGEWSEKYRELGLNILELTGDYELDVYNKIDRYNFIVTTPEKWDSVTRRWKDHTHLVRLVKLFLIDEVHLLNEPHRGPTLEAIVSRMKTVQAYLLREKKPISATEGDSVVSIENYFRFIAVSATIPNIEDIACWLGGSNSIFKKFSDDIRPVNLRKIVLGYPFYRGNSEYKFEYNLSYKIPAIISSYSNSKPTLIFCTTRKACLQTALLISKELDFKLKTNNKEQLLEISATFTDSKLREVVSCGIGYHHAGVEPEDRKKLEQLFLHGHLPVLIATSTLAVGVNLPAHLVIIKSTMHTVSGVVKEYEESGILQMIGRAGRPQFDTSAVAVIMTTLSQKQHYEKIVGGTQMIESSLHESLPEHINSEVVLKTITDIELAVEWIKSTYLYVRIKKNPRHYKIADNLTSNQIEQKLYDLCVRNLNALAQINLITMTEYEIKANNSGVLMARFYIAYETMKRFTNLRGNESLSEILGIVSVCKEFSDFQLRISEKAALNSLNKNKNKEEMSVRFPFTGKIKSREMKINILIQANLGCLPIKEFSLNRESIRLMQLGKRVSKCLVEYLWEVGSRNFLALRNAVILSKCFHSGIWENSFHVAKQLEKIGLNYSNVLVSSGLKTFQDIIERNPRDLEMLLNKAVPFGNVLRKEAMYLPQYEIDVQQSDAISFEKANLTIVVSLTNRQDLLIRQTAGKNHKMVILIGGSDNYVHLKMRLSDSVLLSTDNFKRSVVVYNKEHVSATDLQVLLTSETYCGFDVFKKIKVAFSHDVDKLSPTKDETRIKKSLEQTYLDAHMTPRRKCKHNCSDKQHCGHQCCRVGLPIRTPGSKSSQNKGSDYVSELKQLSSSVTSKRGIDMSEIDSQNDKSEYFNTIDEENSKEELCDSKLHSNEIDRSTSSYFSSSRKRGLMPPLRKYASETKFAEKIPKLDEEELNLGISRGDSKPSKIITNSVLSDDNLHAQRSSQLRQVEADLSIPDFDLLPSDDHFEESNEDNEELSNSVLMELEEEWHPELGSEKKMTESSMRKDENGFNFLQEGILLKNTNKTPKPNIIKCANNSRQTFFSKFSYEKLNIKYVEYGSYNSNEHGSNSSESKLEENFMIDNFDSKELNYCNVKNIMSQINLCNEIKSRSMPSSALKKCDFVATLNSCHVGYDSELRGFSQDKLDTTLNSRAIKDGSELKIFSQDGIDDNSFNNFSNENFYSTQNSKHITNAIANKIEFASSCLSSRKDDGYEKSHFFDSQSRTESIEYLGDSSADIDEVHPTSIIQNKVESPKPISYLLENSGMGLFEFLKTTKGYDPELADYIHNVNDYVINFFESLKG